MKLDLATTVQMKALEKRLLRRIEELEAQLDAVALDAQDRANGAWQTADAALYVANYGGRSGH